MRSFYKLSNFLSAIALLCFVSSAQAQAQLPSVSGTGAASGAANSASGSSVLGGGTNTGIDGNVNSQGNLVTVPTAATRPDRRMAARKVAELVMQPAKTVAVELRDIKANKADSCVGTTDNLFASIQVDTLK